MISNPTELNNICDKIINDSIDANVQDEKVFVSIIQKYI